MDGVLILGIKYSDSVWLNGVWRRGGVWRCGGVWLGGGVGVRSGGDDVEDHEEPISGKALMLLLDSGGNVSFKIREMFT